MISIGELLTALALAEFDPDSQEEPDVLIATCYSDREALGFDSGFERLDFVYLTMPGRRIAVLVNDRHAPGLTVLGDIRARPLPLGALPRRL